ncbi:MAG: hypothetical protein JJW00_04980 [Sulfurimonas sp.]|nr:hypothetical protein [Sulfurimonas sp.]
MKKILSITLVSALALLFFTACSKDPDLKSLDVKKYSSETIERAIKKAGKKTNWRITEFKINEVIAEKTENEKTVWTSIKYSKGKIVFDDNVDASDLQDAIAKELSKSSSH